MHKNILAYYTTEHLKLEVGASVMYKTVYFVCICYLNGIQGCLRGSHKLKLETSMASA